MYSQIYTKKNPDAAVVTFPNHKAIEEMKLKNSFKDESSCTHRSTAKEKCISEMLLLTAFLAFGTDCIDNDMFTLIAAAVMST